MKKLGSLICLNCKARVDAATQEEAEKVIDHAVGLARGIKCGGDKVRLEWTTGQSTVLTTTQTLKENVTEESKPKASPKKQTKKKSSD